MTDQAFLYFTLPANPVADGLGDLNPAVQAAILPGSPYHDIGGARVAMADWAFPRIWLSFQTIVFTLPRWIGTTPDQQIPFQFSAHIETEDGAIEHREFLSLDGADPRRACAEAILSSLPATGTVIAYDAAIERGCLRDLADACPDLAPALLTVCDRIVDLLPVIRNHWYHRDQRGDWSIKAVLPTVTVDLDHARGDLKNGENSKNAYLEAISADITAERLAAIHHALRIHCCMNTWTMIILARHLVGLAPPR